MLELGGSSTTSTSARAYLVCNSRRVLRAIALVTVLVFGFLYYASTTPEHSIVVRASTFISNAASTHSARTSQDAPDFWSAFADAVAKGKPSFAEIKIDKKDGPYISYNPDKDETRPDLLEMSAEQVKEMKFLHTQVFQAIQGLAPGLPFVRGTQGIVTSSGNDGLTILTVSLRMLRIAGCTLPVEILMNKLEDTPCNNILPSLGAQCIDLSTHMTEEALAALKFEKYGFKSAAIAFSSFEQVLYLDNDVFPVMDPASLFTSEPFSTNRMILWPDYWASTTSPFYYQIAGVDAPSLKERASTEAGAILVDKGLYADSLLLAIYYNIYTWGLYYRLFSQGAMGEGDKDTWAAAVRVFSHTPYYVNESPGHVGYQCDGNERAVASAQHHPTDDWYLVKHGIKRKANMFLEDAPQPRVLFVHGNLPKYDAATLLEWWDPHLEWTDLLRCEKGKGKAHRLWGPKNVTIAKYGWDVEKHVWDSMRWVACEHGGDFDMWVNGTWHSEPQFGICEKVVAFYEELLPEEVYEKDVRVHAKQPSWETVYIDEPP